MRYCLLFTLLLAGAAHAEVYKCVVAGKTTYTDKPCEAAAQPAELPPVTTIRRSTADDLAKRHDERLKREKKERDTADAAFLKDHASKAAREKAVRAAIIDGRAIRGMTASELQSALGSADETLPDGRLRYRQDGQRTTVTFKDGVVSHISITKEGRKK